MLTYLIVIANVFITYVSSQYNCIKSQTTVNGKQVCSNEVIFEEHFDKITDEWKNSIKISRSEDEEFVVFDDRRENYYTRNGFLYIQPTLMPDETVTSGEIDLKMCTEQYESPNCKKQAWGFNILPPIYSAQTNSKFFSFKYGRVEVRAQLPSGDWIVPQIWLEPKHKEYGPLLRSGKIIIAEASGNEYLKNKRGDDISSKSLMCGVLVGSNKSRRKRLTKFSSNLVGWNTDFHNYTLEWTPSLLQFWVDGKLSNLVNLDNSRNSLLNILNIPPSDLSIWSGGTSMSPFDKEFYVTLGVTVGGGRNFPEGCVTEGFHNRPWNSASVKFLLNFWEDRHNWYPTWSGGNSALKVDYIKVTSM